MRRVFAIFALFSLSLALECSSGEVYFKFTKKTTTSANRESFEILSGTDSLYTSPSLTNNQERVLEVCIPQTTNNQYTLRMCTTSSYWANGAWLMIDGINGNRVFKGMMTTSGNQTQPLSLYSPINKGETWRYTANVLEGWKDVSFTDSDWTEISLGITGMSVTDTQYFRKSFAGLSGMAAIEFQLKYRYGIVAYINGNEVYRDNMADGEPTSSTLATGGYSIYDYRGVIRPSTVAESTSSVLAGFLAFYAGIDDTNPCFVVPNDVTATGTGFTNPANAFSWSYSSSSSFSGASGSLTAELQGPSLPVVNSIRIWPYTSPTTHASLFTIEGTMFRSTEWNVIMEVEGGSYSSSQWTQWDTITYVNHGYSSVRLTTEKTGTSSVYVNELQFLVCARSIPSFVEYPASSYEYLRKYESVRIVPVMYGYSDCSISPSLPSGVSIDPNTCIISGISTVTGTQLYTITSSLMNHSITGTLTLSFTDCDGTLYKIVRTYKTSPQNEFFRIRNSYDDTLLFELEAGHSHPASRDWTQYLCMTYIKVLDTKLLFLFVCYVA
ncbi:hypothetical protein JH06_5453 [Blastocystis sp. subtype 4]|uniref:hypothetical protein n=1 Tax=Blastocystis sp. subtype 4 TaxID=944170 RepID=UPI0007119FA3|nr:hypothetical protein JH06_5453 [Blastocystis sp. subtype 4]KNB41443.1 hypothetical protein JH06_5453 [Blastocystis sp. subtype 4]|eukprot:XP_014524886.1 hypothetical protein JH06_5453 [Blastocystis sp. subtype 4]